MTTDAHDSGRPLNRETDRVRRRYDRIAGRYDRLIGLAEKLLFGDGRHWVCSQARGEVLEVAVGTGRNLSFYSPDVRLTGIDISPAMLAIARRRAQELGRDIELRLGDAQAIDFPDASFDTVVSTLSLCSIPDDRRAVAEVGRVLRPGGSFLLLEHVGSQVPAVRLVQRLLDRLEADHLLREPLDHLRAENFELVRLERSTLGLVERAVARRGAAYG